MSDEISKNLLQMKLGIALSLAAFVFGFGLGGVFGVAEGRLKASLRDSADSVMESVYRGDAAKAKKTVAKSWSYFKRAHLHAGGMGAAALSMLLLMALMPIRRVERKAVSWLLGIGVIGYPVFWLLAGIRAPSLGSTHAAKESLALIAIPTAGCFILGTLAAFVLFLKFSFEKKKAA